MKVDVCVFLFFQPPFIYFRFVQKMEGEVMRILQQVKEPLSIPSLSFFVREGKTKARF